MRVSGTWANNTYLEAEGEHLQCPPAGYNPGLDPRAVDGNVVAFSKAADAPIVTSFAVSNGTRGADGVWTTEQAQRVLDLTREAGGSIYAAEFFNEANMPSAAPEMPKRLQRDEFRRGIPHFPRLGAQASAPDDEDPRARRRWRSGRCSRTVITAPTVTRCSGHIASEDMMQANPGSLDAVTYHFYGSVSQRCGAWASAPPSRPMR